MAYKISYKVASEQAEQLKNIAKDMDNYVNQVNQIVGKLGNDELLQSVRTDLNKFKQQLEQEKTLLNMASSVITDVIKSFSGVEKKSVGKVDKAKAHNRDFYKRPVAVASAGGAAGAGASAAASAAAGSTVNVSSVSYQSTKSTTVFSGGSSSGMSGASFAGGAGSAANSVASGAADLLKAKASSASATASGIAATSGIAAGIAGLAAAGGGVAAAAVLDKKSEEKIKEDAQTSS